MNKQMKIILYGLSVTSMGMVLMPIFFDKVIVVINILAFISFATIGIMKIFESKGITLKDLDMKIEKRMRQSYQEKQYANFFMYTSIRPLVMIFLIISSLYMITFLIF